MPRNPKPASLLKLEKGTLYGDQLERSELEPRPKARDIRPRCPRYFTIEQKRTWKAIADILDSYGLFVAANTLLIEALTTAVVQYRACLQKQPNQRRGSDQLQLIPLPTTAAAECDDIVSIDVDGRESFNLYFLAQRKLVKEIESLTMALGLSSMALAKVGSAFLEQKRAKEAYFDD